MRDYFRCLDFIQPTGASGAGMRPTPQRSQFRRIVRLAPPSRTNSAAVDHRFRDSSKSTWRDLVHRLRPDLGRHRRTESPAYPRRADLWNPALLQPALATQQIRLLIKGLARFIMPGAPSHRRTRAETKRHVP